MSPKRKVSSKIVVIEASGKGKHIEYEPEIVGAIYDDNVSVLEKEGETLKWGEVYQIFKKEKFSTDAKDNDELQVFKNIIKLGIFIFVAQVFVFPYTNAISWILKHIDLGNGHVCNIKGSLYNISILETW
jgi:hypothetical protein